MLEYMEKDKTYYGKVAERFYLSHFAEIKEKADKANAERAEKRKKLGNVDNSDYEEHYRRDVVVDTRDESCFFATLRHALYPSQMIFVCHTNKYGVFETDFVEDGKDKISEMLGLVDQYENIERIEVPTVRKEDGALHLDLPEKLQHFGKEFYKIKLFNLDGFVADCNYGGWGDCFTSSTLEIIGGLMSQDCIDFEKKEIMLDLNYYVGPGDDEENDTNYYAEFDFSHCELAMDEDNDSWAIYICYKYWALVEM